MNGMIWLWIVSAAVILAVAFGALWLHTLNDALKSAAGMRTDVVPGEPQVIPEIDSTDLEPLTKELADLGFIPLGDLIFTQQAEVEPKEGSITSRSRSLARILAHPMHGCYANLTSVVSSTLIASQPEVITSSTKVPFRIIILTINGDENDGWSYATFHRPVGPLNVVSRHPLQLGHCLEGADARRLLETHLSEREEIAKRAGIIWDLEPTLPKYQAFERRAMGRLKQIYRRVKTAEVVWLMLTFRLKNHNRWMGFLEPKKQ